MMNESNFIMPNWPAPPNVKAIQTTRLGGVSQPPFAALNLGNFTEDSPADIQENRRLLLQELGFEVHDFATAKQVHGSEVAVVAAGGTYEGCDALITDTKGILLGNTVADCVPVLVYDADLPFLIAESMTERMAANP